MLEVRCGDLYLQPNTQEAEARIIVIYESKPVVGCRVRTHLKKSEDKSWDYHSMLILFINTEDVSEMNVSGVAGSWSVWEASATHSINSKMELLYSFYRYFKAYHLIKNK